MYDQGETPTLRRGLWIILWFIVIIVVLWVLIWLIFFRDTSPKETGLHSSNTNQSQSTNKDNSKSNNQKSNANNNGTPSGGGSPSPGAASTELANTGAGDVIVPFVVTTVASALLYQVRLRHKTGAR